MNDQNLAQTPFEGILLVDKPRNKTSFSLVTALRRITSVKKIGHAGTLDPFATGLMVMLVGRKFTSCSENYLIEEKEYECKIVLGITTDSYDCDGKITTTSPLIPSLSDVKNGVNRFQGTIEQKPPMFSAKKIKGKRLYKLARLGIEVDRSPTLVTVKTRLLSYAYPHIFLNIVCSKGTYIRSIGHELGLYLGCGAHVTELRRLRAGLFLIDNSLDGNLLYDPSQQKNCIELLGCRSMRGVK